MLRRVQARIVQARWMCSVLLTDDAACVARISPSRIFERAQPHHSITRRNTQFDDDANLRFTDVAQNQDAWMTSSQVAH